MLQQAVMTNVSNCLFSLLFVGYHALECLVCVGGQAHTGMVKIAQVECPMLICEWNMGKQETIWVFDVGCCLINGVSKVVCING